MPFAPLRPCIGSPTCPNRVSPDSGTKGRCPVHARQQEQQRGTATARGYGADWRRVRNAFIALPENTLCRMCATEGRTEVATEVDHVQPFDGLHDPKRLDPTNLQALCGPHHRRKQSDYTWARRRAGR
jgi:5-methylcytosine-specific restriction protein A